MSDVYPKIRGTTNDLFGVGTSPVQIKNSSGVMEFRDSTDSGYVVVRGAPPVGDNDLSRKVYVDDAARYTTTLGIGSGGDYSNFANAFAAISPNINCQMNVLSDLTDYVPDFFGKILIVGDTRPIMGYSFCDNMTSRNSITELGTGTETLANSGNNLDVTTSGTACDLSGLTNGDTVRIVDNAGAASNKTVSSTSSISGGTRIVLTSTCPGVGGTGSMVTLLPNKKITSNTDIIADLYNPATQVILQGLILEITGSVPATTPGNIIRCGGGQVILDHCVVYHNTGAVVPQIVYAYNYGAIRFINRCNTVLSTATSIAGATAIYAGAGGGVIDADGVTVNLNTHGVGTSYAFRAHSTGILNALYGRAVWPDTAVYNTSGNAALLNAEGFEAQECIWGIRGGLVRASSAKVHGTTGTTGNGFNCTYDGSINAGSSTADNFRRNYNAEHRGFIVNSSCTCTNASVDGMRVYYNGYIHAGGQTMSGNANDFNPTGVGSWYTGNLDSYIKV